MHQPIKTFQVVLFFMGSVILVRNSAVAIGSVVFGIDQANIMQQSLVLKLAAALGSVCPFIITERFRFRMSQVPVIAYPSSCIF